MNPRFALQPKVASLPFFILALSALINPSAAFAERAPLEVPLWPAPGLPSMSVVFPKRRGSKPAPALVVFQGGGYSTPFGSGAVPERYPHGKQANQFAYFVKWGMTPAQALQTAFLTAANVLNYIYNLVPRTLEPVRTGSLVLTWTY